MKFTLFDGKHLDLPSTEREAARYVADMIANGGMIPDAEDETSEALEWDAFYKTISPKSTLSDAIKTTEITPLLERSMEILIREPIEPNLIITSLFQRVQAKGLSTQVLAGAIGSVYAQDIPEGGTYPEVNFQIGGAVQTAYIGKSGIAASFSDEALRYSTWDIMATNFRLMGNALARHKEEKAISFLKSFGTPLFDNQQPATSLFGVTTGRGLDMTGNGSMTMDDLMKGMAHMAEEGFNANILLMHPLFYYKFMQDPVMRGMMLNHGGGSYFGGYSGNPGPQNPWSQGAIGGMGPSNGRQIVPGGNAAGSSATNVVGRSQQANSAFVLPSYMPNRLTIITSPFCTFDPESMSGDIFLLASGQVGFHLVDEEPRTVEWRDEERETVKVKILERYGFAIANEGQGIGLFKNVYARPNYWDGTMNTTHIVQDPNAPGEFPVILPTDNVN